jgi:glutamate-1-semialdehyde 2,1-aminomutase
MMKKIENFANSRLFSREVHDVIPGGAYTYSKRDDQFPVNFPGVITRDKEFSIQKQTLLGATYLRCKNKTRQFLILINTWLEMKGR